MRTRPESSRHATVARRLELLRAELAHDWRGEEAAAGEPVPLAEAGGGRWQSMPWPTSPDADDEAEEVGPPTVPVPGRHASRRRVPVTDRVPVPDPLRRRVALGPGQLAVVALLVAAALGVTCWWVVRSSAATTAVPAALQTSPLGLPSGAPSGAASPMAAGSLGAVPAAGTALSSASSSAADVTVDVEGRVRHPGIVVLPTGDRVVDAIKAAGGIPRRGVLRGINLAAVLTDGQQLMIGAVGGAPATAASVGPEGPDPTGADSAPTSRISLNSATAEQLDTIPGVGPVTAQSILTWRQQNGRFTSVDELMEVDGIGPATLAKIEPYVTL